MRAKYHLTQLIHIIVPALAGTILLYSCKTDVEMINALAEREKVPTLIAKNIEILHTENGKAKVRILAPESSYYQLAEEPYYEFPKGIKVYSYDDSLRVDSELTANYAIYYEKKKLWNARYNVVGVNKKGQILNTEQLFWNELERKIYSDNMVKITSGDDVIFGEGFDTDEKFDNLVIRKMSGEIYLDEQ